jgi:hypothetical protein
MNELARLFGNTAMQHWCMQLTVGVTFELLIPTAFFSLPPLLAALLGGWLAPRLGLVQRIAGVGLAVSDSSGGIDLSGRPPREFTRLRTPGSIPGPPQRTSTGPRPAPG